MNARVAGLEPTRFENDKPLLIVSKWLPKSGHKAADGPYLERYGEKFDPQTGTGDIEIWLPIKA